MSNFSIGLTGLEVAQQAIDLIGTNISNAGTEGYHRQRPVVAPLELGHSGNVSYGGARITDVTRCYNQLLENELLAQRPLMGQVDKELFTLQNIESALGEIGSDNLVSVMRDFFNAVRELSSQPTSQALQEQAVWSADSVTQQFRNLSAFMNRIQEHMRQESEETVGRVNSLSEEIAGLNADIQAAISRGTNANLLRDRRDECISTLSDLVEVQVEEQKNQVVGVNVLAWGMPLVVGSTVTPLEVQSLQGGRLGIGQEGSGHYLDDVRGGELGGLIALKNEIVPSLENRVNTLAGELISQVNRHHVQGAGPAGSFTDLVGWGVGDNLLSDLEAEVTDGSVRVRLVDTSTGAAERHEVTVDVTGGDTLSDVAARFDAINGLNAWMANSALHLSADAGYEFDFLPAVLSDPSTSTLSGTASPDISGVFTGDADETFTCTVRGSDPNGTLAEVGTTDGLTLEVTNGSGELIQSFGIGSGYAPDTVLDCGNGIKLSLSAGDLRIGEDFTIDAWVNTDTSGFLAATGINTFFRGSSAADIAVEDRVKADSTTFASGLSALTSDNANLLRMADIGDTPSDNLGGLSPMNYFQQFVTSVGEAVKIRQGRQDSLENITTQLRMQRDEISGVDVNNQAAQLLVFERMFQAAAKVISTQNSSLQYLMNVV